HLSFTCDGSYFEKARTWRKSNRLKRYLARSSGLLRFLRLSVLRKISVQRFSPFGHRSSPAAKENGPDPATPQFLAWIAAALRPVRFAGRLRAWHTLVFAHSPQGRAASGWRRRR